MSDAKKQLEYWLGDSYFDEETKQELLSIRNDEAEVEDRFYRELEFGTGGLRGGVEFYSKDEDGKWVAVEDNTPVSMNMWGFTPDYFQYSEEYFKEFLSDPKNLENLKAEFFIPLMVNKLINDGTATVEVLDTTSKWFGVTYAADRDATVARIKQLVDEGVYPNKLF